MTAAKRVKMTSTILATFESQLIQIMQFIFLRSMYVVAE